MHKKTSTDTISETFVRSDWVYRFDLGSNFMQTHNGNLCFDYSQTMAHTLFYKNYFVSLSMQNDFVLISEQDPFYYKHNYGLLTIGIG